MRSAKIPGFHVSYGRTLVHSDAKLKLPVIFKTSGLVTLNAEMLMDLALCFVYSIS